MRSLRRLNPVLIMLGLCVGSATAQLSMNGTQLINSQGQVVNPNQNIGSNPGADVVINNQFGVGLEFYFQPPNTADPDSTTVPNYGILAQTEETKENEGEASTTYKIWVRAAGGGGWTKVGNLVNV